MGGMGVDRRGGGRWGGWGWMSFKVQGMKQGVEFQSYET